MQLHIIQQSHDVFSVLECLQADDALLFIHDGVYNLLRHKALLEQQAPFFALAEDLSLRGIAAPAHVKPITMDEFVQLSLKAQHCVSW